MPLMLGFCLSAEGSSKMGLFYGRAANMQTCGTDTVFSHRSDSERSKDGRVYKN